MLLKTANLSTNPLFFTCATHRLPCRFCTDKHVQNVQNDENSTQQKAAMANSLCKCAYTSLVLFSKLKKESEPNEHFFLSTLVWQGLAESCACEFRLNLAKVMVKEVVPVGDLRQQWSCQNLSSGSCSHLALGGLAVQFPMQSL